MNSFSRSNRSEETRPLLIEQDKQHDMIPKEFLQTCHNICWRGCCDFHRIRNTNEPVRIGVYCQLVGAKFLLEVIGASGAIWGASEVFLLRDATIREGQMYSTNDIVRLIALMVGLIFAVRFWWSAKHYFQHDRDYLPIKTHHRRTHHLAFLQIFGSKFVLEVCGGLGATWGVSEALTLRHPPNATQWRIAAGSVGLMFLIRWFFQINAYCLYLPGLWSNPSSIQMKMVRWYNAFIAKLILEVAGAVGAVWGFSEIIWLRTSETVSFWRPVSLGVGAIFALRWVLYLMSFVEEERQSVPSKSQVQEDETREEEVQDLEINDLALNETSSTELAESPRKEVASPSRQEMPTPSPTQAQQSTPLKRLKKQISDIEQQGNTADVT
jgi:hypothetical protein